MEELKPRPASSSPLTPLDFLERAATVYGDCPSIIYNDTTYTWSQTHRRCLQLASSLSSCGIKSGNVVSVVARNIPAMYELQFAVPMSGAVLNNMNVRQDSRTIWVLLLRSESKFVFVDSLSRDLVLQAVSLFPRHIPLPPLFLMLEAMHPSSTTPSSSPYPSLPLGFCSTYEGMVEKGDPEFKWVRPHSECEPKVLNYTSGTQIRSDYI